MADEKRNMSASKYGGYLNLTVYEDMDLVSETSPIPINDIPSPYRPGKYVLIPPFNKKRAWFLYALAFIHLLNLSIQPIPILKECFL
ncbi:MAG: hypothetical protein IKM73_12345 [Acidaminococcaceae bacterium]|nr:hypothetical protein [Acidaminococcaceae bacterium]